MPNGFRTPPTQVDPSGPRMGHRVGHTVAAVKRNHVRRSLLVTFLVACGLGIAAFAPSTAQASTPPTTLPPCTTPAGSYEQISVEWPKLLPWKRKVPIELDATGPKDSWNFGSGIGLWVLLSPEARRHRPLVLALHAAIEAWRQESSQFDSGTGQAIDGVYDRSHLLPGGLADDSAARGKFLPYRVRYSAWEDTLELVTAPSTLDDSGCAEYAVVPAVFQIRTGGRTRRIVLGDQCSNKRQPTIRGKGWSAKASITDGKQDQFTLRLNRYASIPRQVIRVAVIEEESA